MQGWGRAREGPRKKVTSMLNVGGGERISQRKREEMGVLSPGAAQ